MKVIDINHSFFVDVKLLMEKTGVKNSGSQLINKEREF